MIESGAWTWLGLLLLGAWHGINPAMGWLFAVALGLQGGERRAVWQAVPPLALGHMLAVGAVVLLAGVAGLVVPGAYLKWVVAAVLLGFGLLRLLRAGHPRFGGMQVGFRDLTIWSFLMATAHGAGLMVVPLFLGLTAAHAHGHGAPGALSRAQLIPPITDQSAAIAATLLHTAGYLLVMTLVAAIVYERLGLRLLRTHWLNLDRLWAGALILTALLTPLL
ncbi:MAG: hypothetical protein ACE147_12975 [Candidatus Methylomirabilales bacterium]